MSPSDRPEGGDSFAALFEQSQSQAPLRRKPPRVGEVLEAVVVQVGRDAVFVELDGKRQAFMEAEELRAPDGTMTVAVGDVLRARVLEVDATTGNVRLGRSMGRPGNVDALLQAKESGAAVDGKVTKLNKGGLEVELAGVRAFCPISQVDNKYVQDASVFVGKSLRFLVTDVRDGGKSVVLSRRALLERESREAAERALREITVGAVMRGTVTGVRDFGAFVDLGGVEGMIPASEISHERGVAVASAVNVGDVVEVQVREMKDAPDGGAGKKKITLSIKALSKDPWEDVESFVAAGKVHDGAVTRVADFGVFVRLAAGIEGLLHKSELGAKQAMPKAGEAIAVVVKSIDKAARKISLVPAPEGASAGARVAETRLAVGAIVSGAVDRIETYGVFVQIDGTKGRAGRGLVPTAELGVPRGTDLRKAFPEGTKLTCKVLETGDGRLRLSVKGARDDAEAQPLEVVQLHEPSLADRERAHRVAYARDELRARQELLGRSVVDVDETHRQRGVGRAAREDACDHSIRGVLRAATSRQRAVAAPQLVDERSPHAQARPARERHAAPLVVRDEGARKCFAAGRQQVVHVDPRAVSPSQRERRATNDGKVSFRELESMRRDHGE